MFLGEYQHSLDAKGRVVLPRKFREGLDGGCVITKGQEHCLYVFTPDRFQDEVTLIRKLPRTDQRTRKLSRSFFSGAADTAPDKQGRIQVPENLRTYAGLDKDVTVVGVGDRIEIWSQDSWAEFAAQADDYYSGIEEALSEQGI